MSNQTTNYRIAVNQDSELYSHFEPCGEDLKYAKIQFEKISKQIENTDTIELQKEVDFSGKWEKVNF